MGAKLGPLSVEKRQSGAPRGESYKGCEAGTVPAWVQSLVGAGPAKHARNPEGLQFGAQVQREDAERGRLGVWGDRRSPPLPKARPGGLCIQARKSVSFGGLDWQKPVPRGTLADSRAEAERSSRSAPLAFPPLRARSEGRRPRRPAHRGHTHSLRPALPPPGARSAGRSPVRHAYKATPVLRAPPPRARPVALPPPAAPAPFHSPAFPRASRAPRRHHVGHDQELAVRERGDLALAGPEQRGQGRPAGLLRTGKGALRGGGGPERQAGLEGRVPA